MRYDTKVTFYQDKQQYNPNSGRTESNPIELYSTFANVNSTGIKKSEDLFGAVKTDSLTIRFARDLPIKNWNYITIGDDPTKYIAETSLQTLTSIVLITTGVVG